MRTINISDIGGNFYGGMPYNVSWNFNTKSASTCTVSVVNERGSYGTPSLGYASPESVSIGGFTFKGYLTSYTIKETAEAKTLELNYTDTSVDLDRYYVGLFNRWGKNKGLNGRLIILGKTYHPCDTDLDSTVEYSEQEGIVDPCDPCPEMPPDKYENACDEIMSEWEVFPVYYTFNELINNLPVSYTLEGEPKSMKTHRGSYTGSLRQVLDSWCSLLGLAYFWDCFNNQLVIVSRSKKISVPRVSREDVVNLEEGATVENTFARGTVGYLGRKAEIKTYNCKKSTLENLSPLTVEDLLAESSQDREVNFIASCLAYYSEAMRSCYVWFEHYGIYSAKDAEKYITNQTTDTGKPVPDQVLKKMGNMEILDVWSFEGNENQKTNFQSARRSLTSKQKEYLNRSVGGAKGTDDNPNYYFIVAKMNEEVLDKTIELERKLSSQFIGKYWWSRFRTTVPNASNSKTEVSVEAPDGNATWHYTNKTVKNLPIFTFGHEEGSVVSLLDDELKEYNYDMRATKKTSNGTGGDEYEVDGFVLLEREGVWEPNTEFSKWYTSLFDWYKDQLPKKYAQNDGRPPVLLSKYPKAVDDGNIKLLIVRKGSPSTFVVEKEKVSASEHPADTQRQTAKTITRRSPFEDTEIEEVCKYGMCPETSYYKLTVGSKKNMIIHTPIGVERSEGTRSQDSDNKENSKDKVLYGEEPPASNSKGYDVVVNADANFQMFLPKLETTVVSHPKSYNVANISYEYFDNLESSLDKLRGGGGKGSKGDCVPGENEVKKYMSELNDYVKYSQETPTRRASFSMAGIFPKIYTIQQGLTSVTIQVTDQGAFTNYVLEDKIIYPPSTEVLEQRLSQNVPPYKSLNDGKDPINVHNIKDYENAVRNV